MATLRVRGGTVVPLGDDPRVLPDHDVICRDDRVEAVLPTREVQGTFDRTVEAAGRLVMPGFINTHMHFYGTFARGIGKAAPARDFDQVLRHLWWRLDKALTLRDCYYSALVPLVQAVRAGTTTLIDHHASPRAVRGSLDRVAEAVDQAGVRACLCYEVSDRDGGAVAREGIEENAAWIEEVRRRGNPRLAGLFGLHASFTVGDGTLELAVAEARRLGTGFHLHVAEGPGDQRHAMAFHDRRVVERLEAAGVLGPQSLLAHCIHVEPREMEILARTGTAVAHNPQSNLNNAVGMADVAGMQARGVLVGLGTDGMTVRMGQELRTALFVRHLREGNPSAGFLETVALLLRNNARIASRHFDPPVGALAPGHAADLAVLDYRPPTPLDGGTFPGHFVFGIAEADVMTTICAGRVLMEDRRLLLDLDEEEIAAKARECAAAVWERF
jgi:putative selenium metabolism protein SsnA